MRRLRRLAGLSGAALLLSACATAPAPGPAEPLPPPVAAGRALVGAKCAGCHSATPGSPSLYRAAPPLWTMSADYTPDRLRRAAAEEAAHAFAMPRVLLTLAEAEDVVAYVRAMQRADPAARRRLALPPCIATAC